MRLFEMQKFPEKAGLAELVWDKKLDVPVREGDKIGLPRTSEVQFFSLKNGVQFLFEIITLGYGNNPVRRLFFGGTDERPFLVEMDYGAIDGLAESGEAGFYNRIKPKAVRNLESRLGVKSERQGDWFAVPLPFNFDHINAWLELGGGKSVEPKEGKLALNGTRHNLDGVYMGPFADGGYHVFGEGTLVAPDHQDREFKGVHTFFQTEFLTVPQKAD